MSSSKNTSNTNKTAHVMNLLRKNNSTPPAPKPKPEPAPAAPVSSGEPSAAPAAAPAPAQAVAEAPAPVQPTPQSAASSAPPIITALNADSEISLQIRDALSEELEKEEKELGIQDSEEKKPVIPASTAEKPAAEMPAIKREPVHSPESPQSLSTAVSAESAVTAEPVTVPKSVKVPEPIGHAEPVKTPEPAGHAEPVKTPEPAGLAEPVKMPEPAGHAEPVKTPEPAGHAEPVKMPEPAGHAEPVKTPEPADQAEHTYAEKVPQPITLPSLMNIMSKIVDEKADRYIKMLGVCTCPQCRMDVIALALNQLPPKYVVLSPLEYMLKSDMYDTRYSCEVTAQLMRACKQVKENPRHNI